jgi:H+/Cl- antiporter ClcA
MEKVKVSLTILAGVLVGVFGGLASVAIYYLLSNFKKVRGESKNSVN